MQFCRGSLLIIEYTCICCRCMFPWYSQTQGQFVCIFIRICITAAQFNYFTWNSYTWGLLCIVFRRYSHTWEALSMHLYIIFSYLGGILHTFVRGIRIPGGILYVFLRGVSTFTWYSYTCGSLCMHFYMVLAYLCDTLLYFYMIFTYLGGHFVCIFTWYSHTRE